ncbi:MAG: hypothetical protein RLZZ524_1003 [Pseudomonadota bacterium]
MTSPSLDDVWVRTRSGQAHVLRIERPATLAEHLLMRFNGYSTLDRLLTAPERPLALAAVAELIAQGWIEPVVDAQTPTESQWGSMDGLGLAA